jgi:hypothetical protein
VHDTDGEIHPIVICLHPVWGARTTVGQCDRDSAPVDDLAKSVTKSIVDFVEAANDVVGQIPVRVLRVPGRASV